MNVASYRWALRTTLLEQKWDQMTASCCEGLWMEWVVVCVAQTKPDYTLFTWRAPSRSFGTTLRLSGYSQGEDIHISHVILTKHLSGCLRSKVQRNINVISWCWRGWYLWLHYWLDEWSAYLQRSSFPQLMQINTFGVKEALEQLYALLTPTSPPIQKSLLVTHAVFRSHTQSVWVSCNFMTPLHSLFVCSNDDFS